MTYEETIKKISDLNRFGSKLGLERMKVLMDYLGNPQDRQRIIHIAGTNGKGSVCRYTATALQACGYHVGLYTSPALEHFTERIEFDGRPVSQQELIICAEIVFTQADRMVAEGMDSPTEFEIVTAMALVYFERMAADFVILEVGLGGTGDSTNVIEKPMLCVITSISMDHMEYLGNTLSAIAAQKAGILKQRVPLVCCIKDQEAMDTVNRRAAEKQVPVTQVRLEDTKILRTSMEAYTFRAQILGQSYPEVTISMLGQHQVENACVALTILELMRQKGYAALEKEGILAGMKRAVQNGRFEILQRDPYVIIDGAHNRDGAEMLQRAVEKHFGGKRILLLFGILADKEVDQMIQLFGKMGADMVATEPDHPRKLRAEALCHAVQKQGFSCREAGDANGAIEFAKSKKINYDVIIFAGSLYLIGKIRELWNDERYEKQ